MLVSFTDLGMSFGLKDSWKHLLTNRRKDKVQVTVPALRPYKNVSNQATSGAAKWCTNPPLKSLKLTACPPLLAIPQNSLQNS